MTKTKPTRTVSALAVGLALVLLAAAGVYADASSPRADGLAAVVGGTGPGPEVDVILRSDVELRARIALSGSRVGEPSLGRLPPSLLRATLAEIIGEHLIAREARRVQAVTPGAAELLRERSRLETEGGGKARLSALLAAVQASWAEIDAVAARRALVAAFLSANLEGATIVTEAEVQRAFEQSRERYVGVDPAQAKKELSARLAREALDQSIGRWVSVLRARTAVRVYVDYGAS